MATLKSSAEYYERVASIETDLKGIARALATVEDKRKEAGLRFAEGEDVDFSAIDAEETRLTAQRKNLLAAQEQAKLLCERARDAEKEQRERQKIVMRAELRTRILEVAPKVDQAANDLVAALQERKALVREMAALKQETGERMSSNMEGTVREVLAAAGLGEFFHPVGRGEGQRLVDIDAGMIGFSSQERAVLDEEAAKKGTAE